jgi:hypothetical protein
LGAGDPLHALGSDVGDREVVGGVFAGFAEGRGNGGERGVACRCIAVVDVVALGGLAADAVGAAGRGGRPLPRLAGIGIGDRVDAVSAGGGGYLGEAGVGLGDGVDFFRGGEGGVVADVERVLGRLVGGVVGGVFAGCGERATLTTFARTRRARAWAIVLTV